MNQLTCPPARTIHDLAFGKLDETTTKELFAHVDSCPTCETLFASAEASSDTLVDNLRGEAPTISESNDSNYQRAVEAVMQFAHEASAVDAAGSSRAVSEPLGTFRDYELLEKIGEGGMGAVYKAMHTRLQRVVAVKVLPVAKVQDPLAIARFEREMAAAGQLDHPRIVRTHDAGEADGQHFLVMEYIKGIDLSALVKELGPLPPADACELIRQAAEGLAYSHRNDMVHRDIKPSNLILAEADAVKQEAPAIKILDLGLARLDANAGELTDTGQVMGTVDYMAPEQTTDSHEVDGRADIYALGATLYKLLGGVAPFGDEAYQKMVRKLVAVATEEPQSIQHRNANVSDDLAAVVHRMLAKLPDDRYATADDVAAALAPFCVQADLPALLERRAKAGADPLSDSISRGDSAYSAIDTATIDHDSRTPQTATITIDTLAEQPTSDRPVSSQFSPSGRGRVRTLLFTSVALAGFVLATVLTLSLSDGKGDLVIEYDESEGIELVIKQGEKEVDKIELTTGGGTHKLQAGKYEVTIRGLHSDQMALSSDGFELKRRGETKLRIYRKAIAGVAASPSTPEVNDKADPAIPIALLKPAPLHATNPQHKQIHRWARRYGEGKAVLTPNEKYLFVEDGAAVHQFSIASGQLVRSLPSGAGSIHHGKVAVSKDSQQVMVGPVTQHYPAVYEVRNIETGEKLRQFSLEIGRIVQAEFSPDGSTITIVSENAADTSVSRLENGSDKLSIRVVDGRHSYAGLLNHTYAWTTPRKSDEDSSIKIWDVETGEMVKQLNGHTGSVQNVAMSQDGTLVASSSKLDGTIRIWEFSSATEINRMKLSNCGMIAFSNTGETLYANSQNYLNAIDVETGKTTACWHGSAGRSLSMTTNLLADVTNEAEDSERWTTDIRLWRLR